jgi:hypothetical protein
MTGDGGIDLTADQGRQRCARDIAGEVRSPIPQQHGSAYLDDERQPAGDHERNFAVAVIRLVKRRVYALIGR